MDAGTALWEEPSPLLLSGKPISLLLAPAPGLDVSSLRALKLAPRAFPRTWTKEAPSVWTTS
eukprot:8756701-Pyramimonas_sp.AAC.1